MALLDTSLNEDVRAESILAKIDAAEAAETIVSADNPPLVVAEVPAEESPAPVADETAPASEQPSGTDAPATDPAPEPPIEAPASWSKDGKEKFQALPREVQQIVADRERERDAEVRRGQNDTAAKRREADTAEKAAVAQREALALDQQRTAQALAAAAQYMENSDPIIAMYRSTDLQKLARENPAGYTELDAAYKVRVEAIDKTRAEQARLQSAANATIAEREERALLEKVPEWSAPDVGMPAMTALRQNLVTSYAFKPEEIAKIADHRLVLVARDALDAPKLRARVAELEAEKETREKAAKQAIQDKKVPVTGASRTLKPGAASDTDKSASDRNKALIKRASKTNSLSEKADLIAQLV